jgi:ribosomal protein S12 methylthiotransferase
LNNNLKNKYLSFSIISLGCPKNLVDSEKVISHLISAGFNLVQENTEESIVLLNTCAFIKNAIQETEENIQELIKRKNNNNIKYIVVLGCFPSRFKKQELKEKYPEVDLWLPIKEENSIKTLVEKLIAKKNQGKKENELLNSSFQITPTWYSYIKISEGCNNFCGYCTIPKIRGAYNSRALADIKAEIKDKIKLGVKEIILIAEDTTLWGIDFFGKPSLPKLLAELADIKDLAWLRLMYAHPARVDQDLIDIIRQKQNICNYIDIPVQHINNKILKSMNRPYSKQYIIELLQNMRSQIPDITIRTSLIVGYPGEKEADFKELFSFIQEYPFDQLGCFAYSDEQGTAAYELKNKVDEDVIKLRQEKIMEKQFKQVLSQNKRYIGKTVQVIYEGGNQARARFSAPDIDNTILLVKSDNLQVGNFYQVKITAQDGYDLVGKVLH